jgi:hypothetical protein
VKVFISWSGLVSQQVAEVFREWLPSVIQAVTPYVSSEDIDKGARWSSDISSELEGSNFGIICVTRSNVVAPWLNFEAGALSKSFDSSHVSPFLFSVDRSEVTGPLLQFQSTVYERNDVLKLVQSINGACDHALEVSRLEQIFDVWWPRLQSQLEPLNSASESERETGPERPIRAVLAEVLDLVRSQQKLLSSPQDLLPSGYVKEIMGRSYPRSELPRGLVLDLLRAWQSVQEVWFEFAPADEPRSDGIASMEQALARLERPLRWMSRRYDVDMSDRQGFLFGRSKFVDIGKATIEDDSM